MIWTRERKRSRIAVAARTPPRKAPQSWVGLFVVTMVETASWRRTKTSKQVLSCGDAEALHAEVLDDQGVDLEGWTRSFPWPRTPPPRSPGRDRRHCGRAHGIRCG